MKDWRRDDRKGEDGVKTVALERNKRKGVGYRGSQIKRGQEMKQEGGERRVSGGAEGGGSREKSD